MSVSEAGGNNIISDLPILNACVASTKALGDTNDVPYSSGHMKQAPSCIPSRSIGSVLW